MAAGKDIKALIELRAQIRSKTPPFRRTSLLRHPKLEDTWRKPKGRDSKIRERRKGALVQVGYGGPRAVRNMHPTGMFESIVHNKDDLKAIDAKTHVARISAQVGNRKKLEIIEAAKKAKIWVLNPYAKKLEPKKNEEKKVSASALEKEPKATEAKGGKKDEKQAVVKKEEAKGKA